MNEKAGRELDVLIAEKVMDRGLKRAIVIGFNTPEENFKYVEDAIPPPYSTDIAAAWEVVEKLKASDKYCCVSFRWPTCENPEFELIEDGSEEHGPRFYASADTAPLAICLTALKAIGHETDKL